MIEAIIWMALGGSIVIGLVAGYTAWVIMRQEEKGK